MMPRSIVRCMQAVLLAAALLAAGCAKRHRIAIVSNTCWTLKIDNQGDSVVNDCGSTSFRVAGEIHCVTISNLSDTGFVQVRIDDGPIAQTSVPRGSAESCR